MVLNEDRYLTEQIITYIGNKRKLLDNIEAEIINIKNQLGKEKCICSDLFSGSGIVSRMMKKHSNIIITNDMEDYSKIINDCYLTNISDFDEDKYNNYRKELDKYIINNLHEGIISSNYAPKDDNNIQKGERVFYTKRNAMYIDTCIDFILNNIDNDYRKFFMAPLIYETSVHANTSGVFKGFYKDKNTGIGQYGGTAMNCLDRIKADIILKKPILSQYNSNHISFKDDTNVIVKNIEYNMDISYIDPPYNEHPYGSNYFMLNVICNNRLIDNISKVSGIPNDWNKSNYNYKKTALSSFDDLISNLNSKYIIISYNDEGIINKDELNNMLSKYGSVNIKEIVYNTFRGCRNLKNRSNKVNEYLFVLKKN